MWIINVRKQTINDTLQGSVATYLSSGGVVNNQIKEPNFKKSLLLSFSMENIL